MGVYRKNGYSASVEAFLVVEGDRIRLAKTNGATITLAKPHELLPGTVGELLIIVDNDERSTTIILPNGAVANQTVVHYRVTAPF